jgi:hypothetical protein
MTALQGLILDLRRRGVSLEALDGCHLAIDPVEKLRPDELQTLREYKGSILLLLDPARQRQQKCPGDGCVEIITVIDEYGYCPKHRMAVIFTEGVQ